MAQWLDELQRHVLRQPTDVVMALDRGGVRRARLDHVGIEGALDEKASVGEAAGVLFEYADEELADRLALLLGIEHALESGEETIGSVDVDQLDAHVAA